MLLLHRLGIDGEARATPDELEVHLPMVIVERRHNSPEASNEGGIFCAARVLGDRFKLVNLDGLVSAGTALDLLPVH